MGVGSVNVRDVAALAGVSVGTVSNALNSPDKLAESTLNRVRQAIRELGFVRNESARQLRAGSSRTLGLVVLDVTNPFFTDVARGVEDAANDAGIAVFLCNTDERADKEANYLHLLEEQRVQGILITPVDVVSDGLKALRERGMPIVLLDSRASDTEQCSVSVDDEMGGELALTHLLHMGHRRICFAGGPFTLKQVQDRFDGARRAIDDSGLDDVDFTTLATHGLNVSAGLAAGAELVARSLRPTAAFCANDLVALGVLQAVVKQGLRVPQDLAIVGYDDIEFAGAASHPLSSVRRPRQLLGRTAAQLLIDESTSPVTHVHERVLFEPEIVVRFSSSHKLRARRPRVAATA